MKIHVVWEGKTRNPHLRALEQDYRERIAHFNDIVIDELTERRGGSSSVAGATAGEKRLRERVRNSYKVVLDVTGEQWDSRRLAEWLGEQALRGTREVAFLVGSSEGFSAAFKKEADVRLSLSRMTFTHDWTRVLLLEQIYRAFTILRGYPYAR
jgi:23S rRNA (pseudouridine1915-N3)-methyltransferase